MLKKTANLFTTAYLLLMFCAYPFYIEKGYENIGEAKNRFFLYVSIAAFVILGICALLHLFKELWNIHLQKNMVFSQTIRQQILYIVKFLWMTKTVIMLILGVGMILHLM